MKEIKAIVQPFLLPKIVAALRRIPGLPGVTTFEVHGFGRQDANASGAALEESNYFVKKAQIEVVVPDALAERVIETIRERAHTGNPGDGKIFVRSVDDALRISTGERGEKAL